MTKDQWAILMVQDIFWVALHGKQDPQRLKQQRKPLYHIDVAFVYAPMERNCNCCSFETQIVVWDPFADFNKDVHAQWQNPPILRVIGVVNAVTKIVVNAETENVVTEIVLVVTKIMVNGVSAAKAAHAVEAVGL